MSRRLVLFTLLLALLVPASAHALTLSFDVTSGNPAALIVGQTLKVNVRISGLGNFTSPAVGAWDLTVAFDETLITLDQFTYGTGLSAPGFPSQQDAPLVGAGTVQGVEVVAADPNACAAVENNQKGDFVLFKLEYTATNPGGTSLSFVDAAPLNPYLMFDCDINEIQPAAPTLSVTVVPVAAVEPVHGMLLAGALGALVRRRSA